nr:transglutaminase family protein [Methylibium sp.]
MAKAIAAPAAAELEVVHETRYRYTRPVEFAHHIAMLCPRDDALVQQRLAFELAIEPPPPAVRCELDVHGNRRHLFSLAAAHEALTVRATSRVRVVPSRPREAAPAWEAARDGWRYVSGRPIDAAASFVFASPLVPIEPRLRAWAAPSFTAGRPLDEAAIELMHRLHAEFDYAPASTHVATPLIDAFGQRRGVCQDFAHILIGALRALGLAARYVSGYLLTEPAGAPARLVGADASHAWIALALPRAAGPGAAAAIDWLELDPTNDCIAGASHIRVAHGRDYADVTPLRGVIRGGGRHVLEVGVATRRLG